MSESSTDRNPSPPSEESRGVSREILRADSIGDTVFSKHWVFATLMKLLKAVEDEEAGGKGDEEKEASKLHGIEIDGDLENDLCKLWDMTANEDVSLFLEEWKSPDILVSVITKTNAPRVTEICMGILGNMVCTGSISGSLSESGDLVSLVLSMLSGRDPPTLAETCRFLNAALSSPEGSDRWLAAIGEDEEVFQNLAFILQSSTNDDLLHNTVDLVDLILDSSQEMAERWSSPSLVDGLVEAFKQAKSERRGTVSVILHALQLVSLTSLGADCLVEMHEVILPILAGHIAGVCDEEVISVRGREKALASAVTVVNALVGARDEKSELLRTERQLSKNLLKLLRVAQRNRKTSVAENSETSKSSEEPADVQSKNSLRDHSQGAGSNKLAAAAEDSGKSHDATAVAPDPVVCDPARDLLSSLTTFARMVLDLSEEDESLKETLRDKFEEGRDSTCLEILRELLDST